MRERPFLSLINLQSIVHRFELIAPDSELQIMDQAQTGQLGFQLGDTGFGLASALGFLTHSLLGFQRISEQFPMDFRKALARRRPPPSRT